MSSEVEICNMALSNIRAGEINALDENSVQARQCALKYPILRDMLLREVPWAFNKAVKPLALRTDIDVFNWRYVYQYPSDCLNINRAILDYELYSSDTTDTGAYRVYERYANLLPPDLDRQIPYEVMNVDGEKIIVANDQNLRIEYQKKVEDVNLFDPIFTQALSWLLASELAVTIVGAELGRALRADALQVYNGYLQSAVANNQNEQYNETPDSEFISVRR